MRLRLLFKYSSTFLPATVDTEYPQWQLGDAFRFSLPPAAHAYVEYPQRELGDRLRSSLRAQRTMANLNSTRDLNLKAGLGASTDSRRSYLHRFRFSVCRSDLKHPPTAVGGIHNRFANLVCRSDLKHPPTPVDGIHNRFANLVCRWDLNHPPTPVGGIQRTDRKLKRAAYKLSVILGLLLLLLAVAAQAQTSGFTYQGRLTDGGPPANGNYDLQFALFDSLSGGAQVGSTQTINTVAVSNGVFTVSLDFGAKGFTGVSQFLEISVRPTGGSFTLLTPRQQVTSTPYAIRSANASSADTAANATNATNAATATNATQLGGIAASQYVQTNDSRLSDARTPTPGSSTYIQNSASAQASSNFNISGNGTAGGTLSGNLVNATTQFNLNGSRILSNPGFGNLFAGAGTGAANTGGANTFVGSNAGAANTTGFTNAFFGRSAGAANMTGNDNAFFGTDAGVAHTTNGTNSFFGSRVAINDISGKDNAFFGYHAALSNLFGA